MLNQCFATRLAALFLVLAGCVFSTQAQTPGFSYQGKLTDGGQPANGTFDLQFALFDAVSGGAQQGALLTREDVTVTSGVFTVQLDFGVAAFPGAARFLELGVRPGASTGTFTLLAPRQAVNSTPYALRSLNAGSADALSAACVGCVTSGQVGSVAGSVITGAIPAAAVPAGSGNYVQNNTTQQASSNFNISGDGTAGGTLSGNLVNATTQFNLGGSRILSKAGADNLFAGAGAGTANTTGSSNAFFGPSTGGSNTAGSNNTFSGDNAGTANTGGGNNSFFGYRAGFGNTTGSNNTIIGFGANTGANNLSFATALGASATVAASNTIALGRSAGQDAVNVPGALTVTGALTANGAGLTNLNAGNITTGTLDNNRLGVVPTTKGGTGLSAAGAAANYLRSDGTNWASSALQAADLPSGSANYIQNSNSLQASANFNLSGNGTAGGTLSGNLVNATVQFNLNGSRILSNPGGGNLFAGGGAGAANTGSSNAFFGSQAGGANTGGTVNAFFGSDAGGANTGGSQNAFFGSGAGESNTLGSQNAFFGRNAGFANTGGGNAFFGRNAGDTNTTGSQNTIIGQDADVGANNLTFATAIGSGAVVSASNTIVLGRSAGQDAVNVPGTLSGNIVNATAQFNLNNGRVLSIAGADNLFAGISAGASNTTGFQNAFFGLGAGQANTEGTGNVFFGRLTGNFNTTGNSNAFFGRSAGKTNATGGHNTIIGNDADVGANNLSNATAIGAEAIVTASNRIQLGRDGTDTVSIGALTAASATHVCINGTVLSSCSSSLRYKERVQPLRHGLKLIQQLRPVTFNWKERQEPDLGLIAEEVAKVEPLLVTHNKTGVIEGVKYDQLSVVLINAVKELKAENEALQQHNRALEQRLLKLEKQMRSRGRASARR